MALSQLALPILPTVELERSGSFGLRRRDLEGVLPSGSLTVDAALGVRGLPRGRMIELFGPPSIGKTTIALQVVSAVQRAGNTVAFIDVERAFDPKYAGRMGVDLDTLLLVRADDGHQAFRILEKLAASKAVDLIIVDSAAALLPAEERDVAFGASSPFGQCELLASGLRKVSRVLHGSPACVVFLNQVRGYQGFGYSESSVGGWALKLHAAIRADLRVGAEDGLRKRVQLRVIKNQLAKTRSVEFDFADGVGVVPEAELLDLGVANQVISTVRGGFSYDGKSIGKDRGDALQHLSQDPFLAAQIHTDVRAALGLGE